MQKVYENGKSNNLYVQYVFKVKMVNHMESTKSIKITNYFMNMEQ